MIAEAVAEGFAWVVKHWKAVGLAVIIGLLGIQSARVHNLKGDVKTAKAALVDPVTKVKWEALANRRLSDLNTCRDKTTRLTSALDAQNAAVDRLKASGDQLAAQASKAALDARKARQDADAKAREALAYKSAGTCEAQRDAVRGMVAGLVR